MISTNKEKLLKFLDDKDVEAHPAKNIEEENTELVNCHGPHHEHLVQAPLLVTAIPFIAIDNKEEEEDEGKCKDNQGSRQNDCNSSNCTTDSDSAGSSLTSHDLFLSQLKRGLILGIFFVWPAIRIFLFNLLTKCEPIGSLFFVKEIKEQQDQPEMLNWLMAFIYYVPLCTSGAWHKIFMIETLLANYTTLFMYLKSYMRKGGCLCNNGKLYGIMYSPMVTAAVSFLAQIVRMKISNADNLVSWLLITLLFSSLAILLADVGFATSKVVPVTAANGAGDVPALIIVYPICAVGLGLYLYFI